MTSAAWFFLGTVWTIIGVSIFVSMRKIVSDNGK